jgi:hypothetical protein
MPAVPQSKLSVGTSPAITNLLISHLHSGLP